MSSLRRLRRHLGSQLLQIRSSPDFDSVVRSSLLALHRERLSRGSLDRMREAVRRSTSSRVMRLAA
jgi:hypothetical protein